MIGGVFAKNRLKHLGTHFRARQLHSFHCSGSGLFDEREGDECLVTQFFHPCFVPELEEFATKMLAKRNGL